MKNIFDAPFIREISRAASNMYRLGWDERNGGNISMLLEKDEVGKYLDLKKVFRKIPMGFEALPLAGRIFIVTGTGKYFKNVQEAPENNLGIIRIAEDGAMAELLWGYEDGGKFTSELPSHLMSHMARLKQDKENRVIMHSHPTNTLAMTFIHALNDREFSHTLWQMCTECIIVFPEGVGVLPWMLCGNNEIGGATAKKIQDHRIVIWSMHGVYGAGKNLDEAFGLIETVEKAAQIYMKICGLPIKNIITDEELFQLAKSFRVDYREDFLDLPSLERQGKLKDDITPKSD